MILTGENRSIPRKTCPSAICPSYGPRLLGGFLRLNGFVLPGADHFSEVGRLIHFRRLLKCLTVCEEELGGVLKWQSLGKTVISVDYRYVAMQNVSSWRQVLQYRMPSPHAHVRFSNERERFQWTWRRLLSGQRTGLLCCKCMDKCYVMVHSAWHVACDVCVYVHTYIIHTYIHNTWFCM
jgi:hypothetical protein